MNIVVLTKGEWQAFELVLELLRQMGPKDRLLVWDDFSPPDWVDQMNDLAEVKQDAVEKDLGEHRNRVKAHLPENEWIVMIDADERIQTNFVPALNAIAAQAQDADTMFIERQNSSWKPRENIIPPRVDYSKLSDHDFQARVFRNIPEIRFNGVIHHTLRGFKKALYLQGPPFTIIHHRKDCARRYESFVPDYWEYVKNLTQFHAQDVAHYWYDITKWDLVGVRYAQWLHPCEGKKTFTPEGLAYWQKLIHSGDVCLDIGAHTGDTALYMSLAAGPSGLVIAVEPNPQVLPILRANASLNSHIAPIIVHPYAVTETPGEFTFHYSDAHLCNGGYASSLACGVEGGMHRYPLKVTGKTIGDIWPTRRVGFLKIDTEGYDKEILKFSRSFILRDKPVIKTEVFPDLNTEERAQLYDALESCGYNVLTEDLSRTCPKQEVLDVRSCFDIVGIPK